MVAKKLKEKEVAPSRPTQQPVLVRTHDQRVDLAERQIFGMLYVMEKSAQNVGDDAAQKHVKEYRDQLKKIAGDTYEARVAHAESLKGDLMFEAEEYFGTDQARWGNHMKELLLNFEEDVITADLFKAMQELRTAEKAGDQETVAQWAVKCQELSMKKAEILKKKM